MSYVDSVYEVAFASTTGDQWWGVVIADSYLANPGLQVATNYGTYYITKEFEQGVDLGDYGLPQFEDGMTYINSYFDYGSQQWYKPYYNGLGYASGTAGLGSEHDWIVFNDGRVGEFVGGGSRVAVSTQELSLRDLQQGPGFVEAVSILFPQPRVVAGFGLMQGDTLIG